MEVVGLVLGGLGLLLAVAAIILTVTVERLKRPRLEIETADWPHQRPWKFAVVHVFNRPEMPRPFGFLARNSAEGCEATLEFRRHGEQDLAFSPLPARWSSRPEPGVKLALASAIPSAELTPSAASSTTSLSSPQQVVEVFDPGRAVESRTWDVAAGARGQEIAVAVLPKKGGAYAWGAESQAFPDWDNPEWKLDQPGQYDVTVRLDASGIQVEQTFLLELGSPKSRRIGWAAAE